MIIELENSFLHLCERTFPSLVSYKRLAVAASTCHNGPVSYPTSLDITFFLLKNLSFSFPSLA